MKNKIKKLILLLMLLLIIATLGIGSYTYAKYKTAVQGNGGAEIAKWSFKVGTETEQIQNIQLKDTVKEETLTNGKIAPGPSGQFFINIDATDSDVGVNFNVRFNNEKNKPSNVIFRYGGKDYKSLTELGENITGSIAPDDASKTRRIQILWRWEYQTGEENEIATNDELDTQDGISALDYTFDVIVTGTQSRI